MSKQTRLSTTAAYANLERLKEQIIIMWHSTEPKMISYWSGRCGKEQKGQRLNAMGIIGVFWARNILYQTYSIEMQMYHLDLIKTQLLRSY